MKKTIYDATNGIEHHAYESQAKAFQAFKAMVMKRLEQIDGFNPIDYLDDYRTPLWRVWEIQYTCIGGREYFIQPIFVEMED
jgi:hypothetical protein